MPCYGMPWDVLFHSDFESEFQDLSDDVQDELLARLQMVREFGPDRLYKTLFVVPLIEFLLFALLSLFLG